MITTVNYSIVQKNLPEPSKTEMVVTVVAIGLIFALFSFGILYMLGAFDKKG